MSDEHSTHTPRPTASSNDINMPLTFLVAVVGSLIVLAIIILGQAAFRYIEQKELARKMDVEPSELLVAPVGENSTEFYAAQEANLVELAPAIDAVAEQYASE